MEPDDQRWWVRGAASGLSGTPAFEEDGSLVGAIWNSASGSGDPSILMPAERLESVLTQAKALFPNVLAASQDQKAQSIQPGECIGVLYVWGAINKGTFGVASLVENRAAIVLAHHLNSTTTGPRRLALCSAALLSAIPQSSQDQIEMNPSGIIGAVVADSILGTVAIVGADPEGIGLTIRSEDESGSDERHYWMARDPLYLPNALRDALDDVAGFRQA